MLRSWDLKTELSVFSSHIHHGKQRHFYLFFSFCSWVQVVKPLYALCSAAVLQQLCTTGFRNSLCLPKFTILHAPSYARLKALKYRNQREFLWGFSFGWSSDLLREYSITEVWKISLVVHDFLSYWLTCGCVADVPSSPHELSMLTLSQSIRESILQL